MGGLKAILMVRVDIARTVIGTSEAGNQAEQRLGYEKTPGGHDHAAGLQYRPGARRSAESDQSKIEQGR